MPIRRQLQSPRNERHATPDRRHNESGFISLKLALGVGASAVALALMVGGASYGAASTTPDLMTGQIQVNQPAKVQVLETNIEQELCIANAIVKVNAELGFEGHPFGMDAEGTFLGIPYNLNLERNYNAEVYRKVRYCMKGMSIPYEYDPNIAFGTTGQTAITAKLKLSDLIVVVSALNDKRNEYHYTSDGVLGYFASELNKWLTQKAVQDLISKEAAQGANVQEQIDNVMYGALNSYVDKEAAVRCLAAGEEYDWTQSIIGQMLVDAGKAAIIQDFLNRDRNRPQPGVNDITFELIDDVTTGSNPEIIKQATNDNMESAATLLTKDTYEDGNARKVSLAPGVDIPIDYTLNDPRIADGTCVIKADSTATGLTAGDKGEE